MLWKQKKTLMPTAETALPGRETPIPVPAKHHVLENPLAGPFDCHLKRAMFGLGCFWGAERKFWQLDGIFTTAVGYAGGFTPNPTYEEVCSGQTGHNEVVLVIYDEELIKYTDLLKVFWESHDPTQGMRQGNDIGTQYRSGIYAFSKEQCELAEQSRDIYQKALQSKSGSAITTEILKAPMFYYAEAYHQQYLAKNPNGYCGLGGLNIPFPD